MRLTEVFERVLQAPAEELTDESSQETVVNWTSLRHVALLVALENTYKVRFSNAAGVLR